MNILNRIKHKLILDTYYFCLRCNCHVKDYKDFRYCQCTRVNLGFLEYMPNYWSFNEYGFLKEKVGVETFTTNLFECEK